MNICKLPDDEEWLNLALIRRLEADRTSPEPIVRISWSNGDRQTYSGNKAIAIIEAIAEIEAINKSHVRFREEDYA